MTDTPPPHCPDMGWTSRRRLFFGAASLAVIGPGRRSVSAGVAPEPFPTEITATLAGPAGGEMDFWAKPVLAAFGRALPPGTHVRALPVGAADGVTGANQFEAQTAPDGASLMLVPGTAALAWLVGDPRAQFDIGHWVPLVAATVPAIVVLRGGANALTAGRNVRVATQSLIGPGLALPLAIELLGARPEPVVLQSDDEPLNALAGGRIDAILLRGGAATESIGIAGTEAVFSLGMMDDSGARVRDAAFPRLPSLAELHAMMRGQLPGGVLFDAWRAVVAAVQLDFAAVLPPLTPAAMVALWRRAGAEAIQAPELRKLAGEQSARLTGGMAGTAAIAAAMADTATLLELRRWLGTRFNWRPS